MFGNKGPNHFVFAEQGPGAWVQAGCGVFFFFLARSRQDVAIHTSPFLWQVSSLEAEIALLKNLRHERIVQFVSPKLHEWK